MHERGIWVSGGRPKKNAPIPGNAGTGASVWVRYFAGM